MTLPPFDLHRAASFEEATGLLGTYGDDAAVYCGGTELLLLLKLGYGFFGHLVDVKGIPELRRLEAVNGSLEIGAAVTHRELERSPLVRARWSALADMESRVANIRVRTAGTLGGNLCFADPHSDPATFLLAAEAEVVCRRGPAERTLPIGDFVLGPYRTALEPGELLSAVRVPEPPAGAVLSHLKFAFHERPAATVTCLVRLREGLVHEARIAVGSVGAIAVRAPDAEAALIGALPQEAAFENAAAAAADASGAVEDANGSVEYKRNLVRVLVRRALADAVSRAAP